MFDKTFEEMITQYVTFPQGLVRQSSWNKCYCPICNNGSGGNPEPRGGFMFEGEKGRYNCFNCQISFGFDPDWDHPVTKKMREVLDAFNIPKSEYNSIGYAHKVFGTEKEKSVPASKRVVVPKIEVPDFFYNLEDGDPNNLIVQKACQHLKYRNIKPGMHTFWLSSGKSGRGIKETTIAQSFMNRLIIPFHNTNGDLIYYQGRALDKSNKKKYMNVDASRANVLYGMDRLYEDVDYPLFVCEGFFDAIHVKGISVQENKLSPGQIELLRKSPRQKVWIPDKHGDSTHALDQFIKMGWHASIPDIGSSCKDIDDAIRKYGKIHTLKEIMNNIQSADDAKSLLAYENFANM